MPQDQAKNDTARNLSREFVAFNEAAVYFARTFLFELEIVIEETNGAHPQRNTHGEQHVPIVEARPQQHRYDEGGENDEPAHRWC